MHPKKISLSEMPVEIDGRQRRQVDKARDDLAMMMDMALHSSSLLSQ